MFSDQRLRDSSIKTVRIKPGSPDLEVELRIANVTQFKQTLPWSSPHPENPWQLFCAQFDLVEFKCSGETEIEIECVSGIGGAVNET